MARAHANIQVAKYRRPADEIRRFSEIGFTGLKTFGGEILEEFLPDLKGKLAIRIYKEMSSNDPILGAVLFAVAMLIRQVEWKLIPFDDSNESKEHADFVDSCRHDMSVTWSDVMTEILSMLTYGWSWMEVVYKRRDGFTQVSDGTSSRFSDGRIGWRKIALRSQDTLQKWDIDTEGGVQAMHQLTRQGQRAVIPISKSLLFRTEANKNNPEGRSILRNCYIPWKRKTRIEVLEGIGIERDLAGLPVIKPPQGLNIWDPNNPLAIKYKTEAENLVRNIRRDEQEGVLLPFGWELELLTTGGSRAFDTTTIIGRYNNSMAMTCLADFIILGHNNRYGSKALAGNKTQMFQMSVGGWVNAIQDVFNRYELPRLYSYNGFDVSRLCRLEAGQVSLPNLTELAEFVYKLSQAGMKVFPEPTVERNLFRTAGLPTDSVEFGREEPQPDPTVGGSLNGPGNGSKNPKKDGSNPGSGSTTVGKSSKRTQRRR